MDTNAISDRYSQLAETECCLSCGGAINHADAKQGEIGVDLGSGRGTDVLRLAEQVGETGFVYGIDVADGMLKRAAKNAKKLNITNVEFIKSDLESLPLEDAKVDVIISNCTINHVSNKHAIWTEISRILKPGGRFVVSDIYSTDVVPDEYKKDPIAVAECWGGAITRETYLDIIDQSGFSDIRIIEESKPYPKGKIEAVSFTIAGIKQ